MRRTTVVLAALLVYGALPAHAQAPAPAPEPPPSVEGSAQFSFLDTRGNAPTQSLGTGGDLTWRPGPWAHHAKAVFAQNQTDGETSARSLAALFRSARTINTRLSGYLQYDYLHDVFAGVNQRHIIEGGVSAKAVDRERQKLRVDGGIGYLNEQRPDDALQSATLSAGALYRLLISKTADFQYEPRYLLTLADTGAWKFDQLAALNVAINAVFSLKASHTIRYSADPPAGFEKTDTIMAVSLVAKIKRP
ncbi:MAG: DUF481 domain-containing protein [Vicinamibacterales bacterium]